MPYRQQRQAVAQLGLGHSCGRHLREALAAGPGEHRRMRLGADELGVVPLGVV